MSSLSKSLPGHWQDQAVFVLGALLFVSPWLFGYSDLTPAAWSAWVDGVLFMAGAAVAFYYTPYWPEFVVGFLGFWVFLSPRIMGFSNKPVAMTIAVAIGLVVSILPLWSAIVRSREAREAMSKPDLGPPVQPPSRPRYNRAA